MGIYDRDYYRKEGPSVFDSLMPTGLVCRWLIGINIAVFVLQLVTRGAPDGGVTGWLILDTEDVKNGQLWRLFTFAFLHDTSGISHIFFNMLFLWWFGSDVEQLYGPKEFLAIYLVSAVLGGIGFAAWSLGMPSSLDGPSRCLGASGAVTTMLILCALHYPHRIIYAFLFLPIPIWLFALLNVGQDAYRLLTRNEAGVAVSVHLTGAAFALIYYKMQFSITEALRGLMWWKHVRSRPRLKIFDPIPEKEEPVAVAAGGSPGFMDEHLEAKLDAVLEKIARTGKESLSDQEQQVLKQAAAMYKRKRT